MCEPGVVDQCLPVQDEGRLVPAAAAHPDTTIQLAAATQLQPNLTLIPQ